MKEKSGISVWKRKKYQTKLILVICATRLVKLEKVFLFFWIIIGTAERSEYDLAKRRNEAIPDY